MYVDWGAFHEKISQYLGALLQFNFSPLNPLFWIFLLLLCLVLLKTWHIKKAISFCVVVGFLLLATTKLEAVITAWIASQGEIFDPMILRLACGVLLVFITIYYFLVKEND